MQHIPIESWKHILDRLRKVEEYPKNCVALNLCKSTHNNQLWYNTQLGLLQNMVAKICKDVETLGYCVDDYQERCMDIDNTKVFLKAHKFRKVDKKMEEIIKNVAEVAGTVSDLGAVIEVANAKLSEYGVAIQQIKDGNPDLDKDGVVTTYEKLCYNVGKPLVDGAIGKLQNPEIKAKLDVWLPRIGYIAMLISSVVWLYLQLS